VSVGLLLGLYRELIGIIAGAVIGGIVLVVLIALRRITTRTYVPFGPFLIGGAVWGILVQLPR
jgi:leader peptidase (prepilin peptidase)/N-methyltransferase